MLNPTESTRNLPAAVRVTGGDVDQPAANTPASVAYSGFVEACHVISGVAWSYSATPTNGGLKIEDGFGRTIFYIDIAAAGPGQVSFPLPKKGRANTSLIVTLLAGGNSVSGTLSVLNHWTEEE